MAQKVIMSLVDDLDGSGAAETVRFTFEEATYEMELNKAIAEQLGTILTLYKTAGLKVHEVRSAKPARMPFMALQLWAADNGVGASQTGG